MSKLAINGGKPIRDTLFPSQNTIGEAEKKAVMRVLESGVLTGYQGNFTQAFYGGPEVRALEEEWAAHFGVEHGCVVAINSCTSGLIVACRAVNVEREQEVIVTPFSMTCSATAPIIWGGVPIFADIEKDYYCLDVDSIEKKITGKTVGIIVVDLFGQPYDKERLHRLAWKHNLWIIEDAAQAIGSIYQESSSEVKYAGTLSDIGVYSLNQGKHITSGEGGIIVARDLDVAFRCRLIMNHAEAVINSMSESEDEWTQTMAWKYRNGYGMNLRMTEVQAAIARVQLSRLSEFLYSRERNVKILYHDLGQIPGLTMPKVREKCTHTYYVMPIQFDHFEDAWVPRDRFIEAVKAELQPVKDRELEGVPIGCGYIKPIYQMPLFEELYTDEYLPVVCDMYDDRLVILHRFFGPNATMQDLADIVHAFEKVYENRKELI